jgi:hypothetical protein
LGQIEAPAPSAGRRLFGSVGAVVLALMMVPGIVLIGIQITAAHSAVLTEHYGDAEARLLQQAWGKLPRGSKVLGEIGPGNILTGQLTGGIFRPPRGDEREIYEAMLVAPRVSTLVQNDFDFVLINSRWWNVLDAVSQQELRQPCVTVFAHGEAYPGGTFAQVLDLRGCR